LLQHNFVSTLAGHILWIVFPPVGGGLWGWGIASLMKVPARPLIKTCAVAWTISLFVCVFVIGLIGFLTRGPKIQQPIFLTASFLVAGITAAINAHALAGTLGLHSLKEKMGRNTGIAAALGFLVVGLILQFAFGWEVGKPVYGSHSMPTILLWCCLGSALAGGMIIGKTLSDNEEKIKMTMTSQV